MTGRPQRPFIVTFVLTPGLVRGSSGGGNELPIPPKAEQAQLRLPLEQGEYRTYAAVLQTPDGDKVWSGRGLKARAANAGRSVVINLPAKLLVNGYYVLTLSGETAEGTVEEVSEYSFSVLRK